MFHTVQPVSFKTCSESKKDNWDSLKTKPRLPSTATFQTESAFIYASYPAAGEETEARTFLQNQVLLFRLEGDSPPLFLCFHQTESGTEQQTLR